MKRGFTRILLSFLCICLGTALAQTPVFINEIHYDNVSSDVGEGVEIAGPAGTDLTGWTVALYNGSSTQRNVYGTIDLSGTLSDQEGGMGTAWFAQAGIQNGAPDGLALVDAGGNVVQFLSYEGSFTAASGPASGQTSDDIGVAETNSTPVGRSLQLGGTGATYEDFAWQSESDATPGALNNGQSFDGGTPPPPPPPPTPDETPIFVNELHYDNVSGDLNEAVEVAGPAGQSINGWNIVLYNGSNGAPYGTIDLNGTFDDQCNGIGTMAFFFSGIQNGAPDGLALVDDAGDVVQFLSYEGSFTANGGPADGMTSDDIGVGETSGTPADFSLQLGGDGTIYEDFTWEGPQMNTMGDCNVNQNAAPPTPDNNDPDCEIVSVVPGPPVTLSVMLQDTESGLSHVNILKDKNANVMIPAFTPGTTDPIVVIAEKIDQSKGSSVVLEVFDMAGNSTICDPVYTTLSTIAPQDFQLEQNYPNPFNPTTTIRFGVAAEQASVSLKIYDISGREVRTLISEDISAGQYSIEWDGKNNSGAEVAGGVYLYRLTAGSFVQTRQMILLK